MQCRGEYTKTTTQVIQARLKLDRLQNNFLCVGRWQLPQVYVQRQITAVTPNIHSEWNGLMVFNVKSTENGSKDGLMNSNKCEAQIGLNAVTVLATQLSRTKWVVRVSMS